MDSWGSWVLMTIAILLLLIWLAIWFCDRTWPKTETTEYRVAMSNSLMIVSFCVYKFIISNIFCTSHNLCYTIIILVLQDLEKGLIDPQDLPCLHCKFIEWGEMACYTKTCPACDR